jgi:hypothetical protein
MAATNSNVQMSQDEGLEKSFRVCSIAANIAAVLLVDQRVREDLVALDVFECAREGL